LISQYGIGMKSSACWYSRFFTVRTRALGEPIRRTITFDIPKIMKEQKDELDIEKEVVTNPKDHGTRILMRNLNQSIPMGGAAAKVRSYLRSMYRDFLRTGELVLIINGEVQEAIVYNWLSSPYWPNDKGPVDNKIIEWFKEFEIDLNESHIPDPEDPHANPPRLRGKIGILPEGDTKKAGLVCIWRRKVVQGSGAFAETSDNVYRPVAIFGAGNSFASQRVIGELDVSELKVTSFKDAVVWKQGQEEEALKKIKQILNSDPHPLLKMAQNFRALKNSPTVKARIDETMSEIAYATEKALLEFDGDNALGKDFNLVNLEEQPEPTREGISLYQKRLTLIPQFRSDIILELKDHGEDHVWLRVSEGSDKKKWIITVNRNHPFMKTFTEADPDSLEPVLRIALAIGIAEMQGLGAGYESAQFLRHVINDLLRNYLSSKSDAELNYED
jgi:hypothetical protein